MSMTADDLRRAARLSLYRKSFQRFAGQQLRIKPKLPGSPMIPLLMNPAQQLLESVAQEQLRTNGWIRMLIHKYRQPGGSTWAAARCFHLASLHPNIANVVIAHDDETSGHIFGIDKLFYDSMTPDMRPMARYHSKEELVFENPDPRTRTKWPGLGSRITFMTAKNVHAGTGHTIHALHLSEAARFPRAKEVWSSLFPSIPPMQGTIVILESTAHFGGQWFKEFFYQNKHGGMDEYERVFLPWSLSVEYALPVLDGEMQDLDDEERYLQERYRLTKEQLKWRRARIREAGNDAVAKKLFVQEFPLESEEAWIDMNMGVFDARALYELEEHVRAPIRTCTVLPGPTVYDVPDGDLSIWEEPYPGELYDIGVDVASGSETGDWSVAEVFKRRNREQVAEWRGKIGTLDFAVPLYWLGRWYNTGQIAVEMDGLGLGTNDRLNEMGYPFLYIWRKHGTVFPKLTSFSGWHTSYESKKKLVTRMRHYIAHRDIIIHSPVLQNELREFSIRQTEQREFYEGSGQNDDAVMASMIAVTIGVDESMLDGNPMPRPSTPNPEFREPALEDDDWRKPQGEPMVQLVETMKGWQ